ncbi:response regulator transcription factor [Desulfurivibrio alkaliphilus]|uniref:Two component transcriptional regulator, winged helix family n=1 Tax=Desulfurivibrio alkaliphilus (strain DSM 19089 / UNIQEM U267 / AHT2) TaxID=589865 RepID=D6Z2G3_DESAT|nr:response regulator transcription factor [Desulfurivibrio alkaliphilus]ADH85738.1 two component transcriptional regulator, winged helix family [Desulfurivibrio alkaliphilus AHT 2]
MSSGIDTHHILVIDDDPSLLYLCATVLLKEGYQVDYASNQAEAMQALEQNKYDLVILDLNLPDGDGLEIGQRLQQQSIPFLVMTIRSQPAERLLGFESGAADYLIKPFLPHELTHRVRRVLPRLEEPSRFREYTSVPLGRWHFDLKRQVLVAEDGRVTKLTGGEFKLLAALATADGRVISREQLSILVARETGGGHQRTVDVLVSRLRKKIEDNPRQPGIILTVTGAGYRLEKNATPATR